MAWPRSHNGGSWRELVTYICSQKKVINVYMLAQLNLHSYCPGLKAQGMA